MHPRLSRFAHRVASSALAMVPITFLPVTAPGSPPTPTHPLHFEKRVLSDRYLCDGVTSGDLNHDGHLDVVAGPFIYLGPEFQKRIEFYPARDFPTEPSPTDSMYSHVHDFDHDGWPDILVLGRVHLHQAFWYQNSKGGPGPWTKHFAFHRIQGESPPFADVDGDGNPELVAHWQNRWGRITPDPSAPTHEWRFHPFTAEGQWHHFYHGEGLGDLDGDGRTDLLLNEGWYRQPAHSAKTWERHPFAFAEKGGAQMFAFDVDGDHDNDVVTALDAHGWGIAWFENVRAQGSTSFRKHPILGSRDEAPTYGMAFSQPHALAIGDLDGDGLTDLVTGKRRWAHGPKGDIEPNAPPVVCWFRLERPTGQSPRFVPHLIDDASGIGVQITIADMNADGHPDILTASKLGLFLFLNRGSTP